MLKVEHFLAILPAKLPRTSMNRRQLASLISRSPSTKHAIFRAPETQVPLALTRHLSYHLSSQRHVTKPGSQPWKMRLPSRFSVRRNTHGRRVPDIAPQEGSNQEATLPPNLPKQCPGCGAKYQMTDSNKPGYFVPHLVMGPNPLKEINFKISSGTLTLGEYKSALANLDENLRNKLVNQSDGQRPASDADSSTLSDKSTSSSPQSQSPAERNIVCKRCFSLIHYRKITTDWKSDMVLDRSYLQFLRKQRNAVVVKVFDITDFPHSFFTGLTDEIGFYNPLVLVANKCDLLPRADAVNLADIKRWIRAELRRMGDRDPDVIHFVSATGKHGIDALMRDIANLRAPADDVYIVGSANVGKSALVNAMLARGFDRSSRVTSSTVPGTTIGKIGVPLLSFGRLLLRSGLSKGSAEGRMVYDTPGFASEQHLYRILEANEINEVTSRRVLRPFAFELDSGQTLLLGALARLDVLETSSPLFATIFSFIAPHITSTERASEILNELYSGTSTVLPIPTGDADRLKSFPHLEPAREFQFRGKGRKHAVIDVAVSGVGWIALGGSFEAATVRVSTPNGWGVALREPPMLPMFKWSLRKFFGEGKRAMI